MGLTPCARHAARTVEEHCSTVSMMLKSSSSFRLRVVSHSNCSPGSIKTAATGKGEEDEESESPNVFACLFVAACCG